MAEVPYNPASERDASFVPNTAQANPNAFGAQMGQQMDKAGADVTQVADKFRGLLNDTAMTNADTELATRVGKIKGEYMSQTGTAAVNAFPKYQQDLISAYNDVKSTLNGGAIHGFDMLATKTIANHVADGSGYMASQAKQAQRESGTSLQNVNVAALLDPQVASDPERAAYHQATALHGLQMSMDENAPGMKTDEKTGVVSFDLSKPEGIAAKANYDAKVDDLITQAQTNRFTTLAKGDLWGAHSLYQQEREHLPKEAQVHLDATFAPKIFDAKVDMGKTEVLANAEQEHLQILHNPEPLAIKNNNPGNLRDPKTQEFMKFSTPEEGAAAMEHDLSVKIGGKSAAMEANYGKGYTPTIRTLISTYAPKKENDTESYINTVSKGAGIDANTKLTQDDIKKIMPVMQNVEGGSASMAKVFGKTPSYATNERGAPLSKADYYRTNSEKILENGDALAERDMPGDLAYKHAMRETLSNYMNKTISNETVQYTQDNRNITRAILGDMTKGQPPMTRAELEAIPGIKPILDRVQYQDPKFAEGINRQIAESSRQNVTSNSPNAYDVLQRALKTEKTPNSIDSIDHLDRLLGRSDGTGINKKDYNDLKQVLDTSATWKKYLKTNIDTITNANGNIDGKGQERAIDWYNKVSAAKKIADGDKTPEADFIKGIEDKAHALNPKPPSTMQQISNWVKDKTSLGHVMVVSPDGVRGLVPASQLKDAIASGYKEVQ